MDADGPKKSILKPMALNVLRGKQELPVARSTEQQKNMGEAALNNNESLNLVEQYSVDPAEYPIFSKQGGIREDKITKKDVEKNLNINETVGLMVGSTAKLISTITGEDETIPAADAVIYLDKSARPVSWLVDDLWDELTDKEKPDESYLAIDRKNWFPRVGIELKGNEEIVDPDGTLRPATGSDFWEAYDNIPEEKKLEIRARIRALYIKDGIEDENPEKIMSTPTILDGKNLLIVDEFKRSGSTLDIAKGLLKEAIPELESINGCYFWNDGVRTTEAGNQPGLTPVWYPKDHADWRGRGVKDIDEAYYRNLYNNDPTPINRAKAYGAFVLGVPLDFEEEPGQLSKEFRREISKIRDDYVNDHILPSLPSVPGGSEIARAMIDKMMKKGVEFVPEERGRNNPRAFLNLKNKVYK